MPFITRSTVYHVMLDQPALALKVVHGYVCLYVYRISVTHTTKYRSHMPDTYEALSRMRYNFDFLQHHGGVL